MIGDRVFSIPTPITTPIPTTTRIPSPQDQPSGYWIIIEPVSDKEVGDIFTVNATTNLSAGEPILFMVYSPPHSSMKSSPEWFSGATEESVVVFGHDGINVTFFRVNTSSFFPNMYLITESAILENSSDSIKMNITDQHYHGR
jgi:hypothetical protein